MEILRKTKRLLFINKPIGVPSQTDPSGDPDALSLSSDELSAMGERPELWLVHRLDRVVGGVIVFARDRASAAELSGELSSDGFSKEYLAVTEGRAEAGELFDYLFKDARQGKAFLSPTQRKGFKEARLTLEPLAEVETEGGVRTLVRVRLHTGRFHQIRAQLSSRHLPLVGDGKYGSRDKGARFPSLFAYKLCISTRSFDECVTALPTLDSYPWCLFDRKIYEELL